MATERTVSVVIPTIGRASLRTAVESALRQTPPPIEVIVVLDADCEPDLPPSTAVRVLKTSGAVGPSAAKHLGIESASGEIIALLDDDDSWRDNKLEVQLAAAPPGDEWIVSSRFYIHAPGSEPIIGPRILIRRDEAIAAYLFEIRVPRAFNMVPTPTMIFPRALAQAVPMSVAAGSIHDDPKWLMEVRRAFPDLPIIQVPEPLVDINWSPVSISRPQADRSKALIEWGIRELADESPRTRGDYMLTSPVGSALSTGSFSGVTASLSAGVRFGRPGPLAWASIAKSMAKLAAGRMKNAMRGSARRP